MSSGTPATTVTTPGPSVPVTPATQGGFPVLSVVIGAVILIIVAIAAVFIRRWWIRRQNPALFRKYN
ncbi:MAG: hypothetical protein WC342_00170 [Methanoregula sp.]